MGQSSNYRKFWIWKVNGKNYLCYGFQQEGHELIEAIKNNTGGFTTVLDGLKAYLEHGIELQLIGDKFPNIEQK